MLGGKNKHVQARFTIVELLIVVIVIAILAAITIVAYNGIRDRASDSAAKTELSQAGTKLAANKVLNGGVYAQDWTAAQSAGVTFSSDTTVNYYSNGSSYCLQTQKNAKNYFISSDDTTPRTGSCTNDGIVSWMPMNGSANDSVATSSSVSVTGASLTVGQNGLSNGAYLFNSSSLITSSMQYPTSASQPFSVSVWSKGTASSSTAWGYVARQGASTDVGNSVWLIGIQQGQQFTFSVNGQWSSGGAGVTASASSWSHLVLTYDGSTVKGYVDGALKVSANVGAITNAVPGGGIGLGQYRQVVHLLGLWMT